MSFFSVCPYDDWNRIFNTFDFYLNRAVGMPRMEKVIVQNTDTKNSLHLLSISGSTVHFHCSFFQDKVSISILITTTLFQILSSSQRTPFICWVEFFNVCDHFSTLSFLSYFGVGLPAATIVFWESIFFNRFFSLLSHQYYTFLQFNLWTDTGLCFEFKSHLRILGNVNLRILQQKKRKMCESNFWPSARAVTQTWPYGAMLMYIPQSYWLVKLLMTWN